MTLLIVPFILFLCIRHGVFTVPGPDPTKQEVFEGQWLEGKMHGVGILR